jgi:hypothetical protein
MWEYGFVEMTGGPLAPWLFKTSGLAIQENELLTLLNRLRREDWEVILVNAFGSYLLKRPSK